MDGTEAQRRRAVQSRRLPSARTGRALCVAGIALAGTLAGATLGWAGALDGPVRWQRYENDRFPFGLDLPVSVVLTHPPSDNNDGVTFSSRTGGRARGAAYGSYKDDETTLAGEAESSLADCADRSKVYRVVRLTFMVVSCRLKNGRIYYKKSVLAADDVLASFYVEYAEDEAARWGPLVDHMSKSFQGSAGR